MTIQRKDVLSYMLFLIIVMIVMNLFTIFTVWRADFERKIRIQRNKEIDEFEKLTQGPPHPKILQQMDEINAKHGKDGWVSVRFVSQNGMIKLISQVPGGVMSNDEMTELGKSIMSRLEEEGADTSRLVEGTIMIRRLRRALGGSGLEARKTHDLKPADIWKKLADWPNNEKLLNDGTLGEILRFTSEVRILQAKSSRRGTQLKLEVLLDGGQVGIFKPAWYPRDVIIEGDAYGGKDRHFGEVASFYLSQVLGYTNIPLVTGRKLNLLREILPLSTKQLNSTFFYNKQGDICFYGICYYCNINDPVCADGEVIEGALVLLMKQKLKHIANPWRRTYQKNKLSKWEKDLGYCKSFVLPGLTSAEQEQFILDIVAVAAFDFLIGNADRHHFDLYANISKDSSFAEAGFGHSRSIVLVDNGKSFGNYREDYFDILAPLFQCCRIRGSLYTTLKKYKGVLGKSLESITSFDPLYPLLTPSHLRALDRRLKIILATVHECQARNQNAQVII